MTQQEALRRDVTCTPAVPLTDDHQGHTAAVHVIVDGHRVVGVVLRRQFSDGQGRGGGVQDGATWEQKPRWVEAQLSSLFFSPTHLRIDGSSQAWSQPRPTGRRG